MRCLSSWAGEIMRAVVFSFLLIALAGFLPGPATAGCDETRASVVRWTMAPVNGRTDRSESEMGGQGPEIERGVAR